MSYLVPTKILPDVICSLDDFYPDYNAMALSELFYLKNKYPNFKVTLFAIPEKIADSYGFFEEIAKIDWIELGVHGMLHDPINECENWDDTTSEFVLSAMEQFDCFKKIFKAPSWKYSQSLYNQLNLRDWICADLESKDEHPQGLVVYPTTHPWCVHGHTWNLNNPDPKYNNGIRQIIERGVPWDKNTKFHFIKEGL